VYRTHQKVREDSNSLSPGRYDKCRRADSRHRAVHTGDQCSISGPSSRRRCVRGIVCARLSPPEHRSHPLTSIIIVRRVRRCNDDIAWLQLLWSSGGHYLSPPRATVQSRCASVAIADRRALTAALAWCRRRGLVSRDRAARGALMPPAALYGVLRSVWCTHTTPIAPCPSPVHPCPI
jgi:hypothetical protein